MISNEKQFWSVGYAKNWGHWHVRKAKADSPDDYELIEDLGTSLKTACVEFDGEFYAVSDKDNFVFSSESIPNLFVVTTSGKLYTKPVGSPIEQSILIAENVDKVSVCRGWRNDSAEANLGLVVAYLKTDGKAYYREYNLNSTKDLVWLGEEQLDTDGDNTNIQVVRLNDFRIGIFVEGSNKMFISERKYLGGTSKAEYSYLNADNEFSTIPFRTVDEPEESFKTLYVTLNSPTEVLIEGNYPIYKRDEDFDDFMLVGSPPAGQGIKGVRVEEGNLIVELVQPITSPIAYLEIKVKSLNRTQYEKTPQCRPVLPEISFILMMEPILFEEHSYINVTDEVTISMKERKDYHNSYEEEHSYLKITNSTASISMKEVQDINKEFEEKSYLQITNSTASISMIQSGKLPV